MLLEGLAKKGFGNEQLTEMQKIIDAEKSDLFDVLPHYITEGVGELDREKLTPLLKLKYHNSLPDALADLGKPDEIGQVFAEFQR